MASLVKSGKYGAINTANTTTNGFHVIMFISEEYTLKKDLTIEGNIISAGELVVKAPYLCCMQENTHRYWKKQPMSQTIIVPTHTTILVLMFL